jgi:hypothetical protein
VRHWAHLTLSELNDEDVSAAMCCGIGLSFYAVQIKEIPYIAFTRDTLDMLLRTFLFTSLRAKTSNPKNAKHFDCHGLSSSQ